jgi:capsular exopolysaccharide synthesis family protein
LLKRRWIIIASVVIFVSTVAILSFTAKPVFRATTVILIEQEEPKVVSFQEIYKIEGGKEDYYQTQYKILTSRSLAKRVIEELDLLSYPEFAGDKDPITSFINRITVEPVRESRLVKVSFDWSDPQGAASIVNTIANAYIRQTMEIKMSTTKYAVQWLTQQTDDLKKKLKESEDALQDYIEQNQIVSLPTKEEELDNVLRELKQRKITLEQQIAQVALRYKAQHPEMLSLNSELDEVNKKIKEESQKIINLRKKLIQYNALKREVETNRELYEVLLKRVKEASISGELQSSNIRIVDVAEPPRSPIAPKKQLNIAIALVLSLFLSTGLVFFIEYLDNTVKTADDIELYVQLPFLGSIPSARKDARDEKTVDLLCHIKPRSVVSENYRAIRTAVIFSATEDRPIRSISFTSSNPREGKTTISLNSAIVMAQAGDKVLFVDADLRKPRIFKTFDLDNTKGLSTYLVGKTEFDDSLVSSFIPNLTIVCSGPIPPNPSELLSSSRMKDFLAEASRKFDRVVFDVPPILSVTDPAIMANMLDGVILVVRNSLTPIEAVIRAKQKLIESKARIIGVVLNNVESSHESYYYSYYSYKEEEEESKETPQKT